MDFERLTTDDKKKLDNWLRTAAYYCNSDENEILKICYRLEREIEYETNFSSDEYKAYKKSNEKPIEINGVVFDDAAIEKIGNEYIKKLDEDKRKAESLLNKDHTKAMEWMVNTNAFLDNEALAYGKDEDYGNIKSDIKDFQDMFINYIHHLAKGRIDHELYNDEIDDWYYQRKDTDKRFERPEYYFPSSVFVFKYKDKYWYYSETSGQGTIFNLCVLDATGIEKLRKEYGLSHNDFEDKLYYI